MVMNGKTIAIPVVAFILSFVIEFLANKVSFFSLKVASGMFWFSIGFAGLLVFLELFAAVRGFIAENITAPLELAGRRREEISEESEEIEELLDFEIDEEPFEKLEEHYETIKESEFSREALLPYMGRWYAHLDSVHSKIREEEDEEDLEDYNDKIEGLESEIKELKEEKEREQMDENRRAESDKEKYLEENEDHLYFETEDLSQEEEGWLEEEDFERVHQWCIHNRVSTEMMVRPRSNESVSHAYLVGAISEYLESELGEDDVKIYETKLPDIVFTFNGKKWAIEVETGTMYKKNRKELEKKADTNNKKYGDRWFFIVSNKNLLSSYRSYGDTVDRSGVIKKIDGILGN